MRSLTTDSLSSAIYELIQQGMKITVPKVKDKFRAWALNDSASHSILKLVSSIPVENKHSEQAIEAHIKSSEEWKQLLADIAKEATNRSASATLSISVTTAAVTKR